MLYVALTRARERLFLSACWQRSRGSQPERRQPSRWLSALPPARRRTTVRQRKDWIAVHSTTEPAMEIQAEPLEPIPAAPFPPSAPAADPDVDAFLNLSVFFA